MSGSHGGGGGGGVVVVVGGGGGDGWGLKLAGPRQVRGAGGGAKAARQASPRRQAGLLKSAQGVLGSCGPGLPAPAGRLPHQVRTKPGRVAGEGTGLLPPLPRCETAAGVVGRLALATGLVTFGDLCSASLGLPPCFVPCPADHFGHCHLYHLCFFLACQGQNAARELSLGFIVLLLFSCPALLW